MPQYRLHERKEDWDRDVVKRVQHGYLYAEWWTWRLFDYATHPVLLFTLAAVSYFYPTSLPGRLVKAGGVRLNGVSNALLTIAATKLTVLHSALKGSQGQGETGVLDNPNFFAPVVSALLTFPLSAAPQLLTAASAARRRRIEIELFGSKEDYEKLTKRAKAAFERRDFYNAASFHYQAREAFVRLYGNELHRPEKQATLVAHYLNYAKALFMLGKYKAEKGHNDGVIEVLDEILKRVKNDVGCLNLKGLAHLSLGEDKPAGDAFKESLGLNSTQADIDLFAAHLSANHSRVIYHDAFQYEDLIAQGTAHLLLKCRSKSAAFLFLKGIMGGVDVGSFSDFIRSRFFADAPKGGADGATMDRKGKGKADKAEATTKAIEGGALIDADKNNKPLRIALESQLAALRALPENPLYLEIRANYLMEMGDLYILLAECLGDSARSFYFTPPIPAPEAGRANTMPPVLEGPTAQTSPSHATGGGGAASAADAAAGTGAATSPLRRVSVPIVGAADVKVGEMVDKESALQRAATLYEEAKALLDVLSASDSEEREALTNSLSIRTAYSLERKPLKITPFKEVLCR